MPRAALLLALALAGCAAPAQTTLLVVVDETYVVTGPEGATLLNELGEHCPDWTLDGTVLQMETDRRRAPAAVLVRDVQGEGPVVQVGSAPHAQTADALPATFEVRSLFDRDQALFEVLVDADGRVSWTEAPAKHVVETDEGSFEVVETFDVTAEPVTPVRIVEPKPCD